MKQIYDRIRKIVKWTPKCDKLLDLGCDRGDVTVHYKSRAKQVFGVDNNPDAIKDAKKRFKGINFVLAKGERLPFAAKFFDVVVMGDVLEHVENERKTLNEVYRVLKPGGKLVLSVPHKGLFGFIDSFNLKFQFPRLYKLWKGKNFDKNVYKIQPWHRHYDVKGLKRLFGKRFSIQKVHRGGLILYPIIWVAEDMFHPKRGQKIINALRHIEYQIPFGKWGYHIILIAQKQ